MPEEILDQRIEAIWRHFESVGFTNLVGRLVLGQNQALPDLEERIMTLRPGESAESEVRFPDDHPDEARRGQTRQVRVTLHEVKRQELPGLDDSLRLITGLGLAVKWVRRGWGKPIFD